MVYDDDIANYTISLNYAINNLAFNLFDFEYEKTSDKDYIKLQTDFINHFKFREIGAETVDRFKEYFKRTWLEKISIYNKKWQAITQNITIMQNYKGSNSNKQVFQDTPTSKIGDVDYATNITDNTNNNAGYNNITEIELLNTYLNELKNIDLEFFKEFETCFMCIF